MKTDTHKATSAKLIGTYMQAFSHYNFITQKIIQITYHAIISIYLGCSRFADTTVTHSDVERSLSSLVQPLTIY